MLPIFPLAKNVLSICRQNSPSIESNNNHYTKNILAILARKCAEIRWLQKIAVIWLQIFEGSYFAKTSPRFQNSGELFCHFQDLIFFSGELFCHPGELFCGGAILSSRGAILLHRTWRSKRYIHLHSGHLILALLGFQFLDFWLKPFVDPMPVELWESAIYQKFCLSKLVWLQK